MARVFLIIVAIAVATVAMSACSPTRALNAIASSDSYELATVAYGVGERGQLDIYTPRAADTGGSRCGAIGNFSSAW